MCELSEKERGDIFERLVQLYLRTDPVYSTALTDVWLLRDVPARVRAEVNLPRADKGIDLLARCKDGTYWAIQAKYRTRDEVALGWGELSTFFALSSTPRRNISLAVVAHTSARPISNRELMGARTVEIGLDRWQAADWSLILGVLETGTRPLPLRCSPRDYQQSAIDAAVQHFAANPRGRLIMPCGTGKSLVAYWIAEALRAKTIIIAVPSLNLIVQTVADWVREFVARGANPNWLCVASDDTVGQDDVAIETYDTGLPTFTDVNEIARQLRLPGLPKVVFVTYHSSATLAEAVRNAGVVVDLIVFDEAHRTAGVREKTFATLLHEDSILVRHRLFMTATERVIKNGGDDVFQMNDHVTDYGARFFSMTFKKAIDLRIICDYEIVTVGVTEREVRDLIAKNRLLTLHPELAEIPAEEAAIGVAVKRAMAELGLKKVLTFHSRIGDAAACRDQQDVLNCLGPVSENFHVSSQMSAGERKFRLALFASAARAVMTNARCLTEGVDVPNIDCIVFAAPKQSTIDIVQAAGRVMRKAPGKEKGYIVIPLVIPEDKNVNFEEFAATTAFKTVARVVLALSTQDERIVEELRAIFNGRKRRAGKRIKFIGTVPIGFHMSLERFSDAISVKVWGRMACVYPRSLIEVSDLARSLGITDVNEWFAYWQSHERPADIPIRPDRTYANDGWPGWEKFFGRGLRPFAEAREFARSLDLKSENEWREYWRSHERPDDIQSYPDEAYANEGWDGWGDFLGSGNRRRHRLGWRPFAEAREFARSLDLKSSQEWQAFARSNEMPDDIPSAVHRIYAKDWNGWGDFLGTSNKRYGSWRPFAEAREFARSLDLKGAREWDAYWRLHERPTDIPAAPNRIYAKDWGGWGDFLGTGNKVGTYKRQFHRLGLGGGAHGAATEGKA